MICKVNQVWVIWSMDKMAVNILPECFSDESSESRKGLVNHGHAFSAFLDFSIHFGTIYLNSSVKNSNVEQSFCQPHILVKVLLA